jgi:hypothetical protein
MAATAAATAIPENQCPLLERILSSTKSDALEKIHRMFLQCQQNMELVNDIQEYLQDVMGLEFSKGEFDNLIEHCVKKNESGM